MAGSFIWYELMTPDPVGAAAFYGAVIGWDIPLQGGAMPNGSTYRLIGRPDGGVAGGVLELTPGMAEAGATPAWFPYFDAPDLTATIARAVAAGATVHMPERELESGRMAMLADPGGAAFYLMAPVPPPGQPDAVSDVFSETATHRVGWNELATPDPEGALAFYAGLFGWESPSSMDMGEYGTYHFVAHGGQQIGAIYPLQGEGRAAWTFYVRVPDVRAAAAAITTHGGAITHDLHAVPGGDLIVTGTDPQGAAFALVGKA